MSYDIGRELIVPEAKKLFADLKRLLVKLGTDAKDEVKAAAANSAIAATQKVRHALGEIETALNEVSARAPSSREPIKTTINVVEENNTRGENEEPKP